MLIHGEYVDDLIAWIKKKFEIDVLSAENTEGSVPVEDTEFWKEMEKNRVGNLLAAARLKAGLTQSELANKLAIRQNMVSDFERGRRSLSAGMVKRFSRALSIEDKRLHTVGVWEEKHDANNLRVKR